MAIIYLNKAQLLDTRISSVLTRYPYDWASLDSMNKLNDVPSYNIRSGKNILPFNNSVVSYVNTEMPLFDKNFNLSLGEIMDQRCQQLSYTRRDKPWLVFWSGGIDSTSVLSSILKNIPKADREQIYVACNKISVYENPRFYYDHVIPNFKTIDSTTLQINIKLLSDYHIITGELSDQLFSGRVALGLSNGDLERDLYRDPELLIDYINLKIKNRTASELFYQLLITNNQSTDITLSTYHDFFWWFYFNLVWTSVKLRAALATIEYSPEYMKLFLKNDVCWFETDEFQHWAMHNNRVGIKYGTNAAESKLELKRYIHDYNRDDYYFKFKTKGSSVSRQFFLPNWFCLLDDFTMLNLDDDLEQILELLPGFIV
jgi:asparagine synthetase B (glutamine-hydrolysing)